MTPESRSWMTLAEADLQAAHLLRPTLAHLATYHAQQAAEKAIKALLVGRGLSFPHTHDLERLSALLDDRDRLPVSVRTLAGLTAWNTAGRYPDNLPMPSPSEAEEAIGDAEQVVEAARERLMGSPP